MAVTRWNRLTLTVLWTNMFFQAQRQSKVALLIMFLVVVVVVRPRPLVLLDNTGTHRLLEGLVIVRIPLFTQAILPLDALKLAGHGTLLPISALCQLAFPDNIGTELHASTLEQFYQVDKNNKFGMIKDFNPLFVQMLIQCVLES